MNTFTTLVSQHHSAPPEHVLIFPNGNSAPINKACPSLLPSAPGAPVPHLVSMNLSTLDMKITQYFPLCP